MSDEIKPEQPSGGMTLGDIYFVLFRQKWIIIICSLLGVAAAAVLCALKPPLFHSTATLFIKYVAEGNSLSAPGSAAATTHALNEQEASILNIEGQIIQSSDVSRQAAEAVGAEKILAKLGGGSDVNQAASIVYRNLEIDMTPQKGSVISLDFKHPDPDVAQQVLSQIIVAYKIKHNKMHHTVGLDVDSLLQETERVNSELADTERQLKIAKSKAGVTDLEEGKKAYTMQISKKRDELLSVEAEIAKHLAAIKELPPIEHAVSATTNTNTESRIPAEQVSQYKELSARLVVLTRKKEELKTIYREASEPVKEIQQQIEEAAQEKKELEEQDPGFNSLNIALPVASGQTASPIDRANEEMQIRLLQSQTNVLNSQLAQIQADASKLDDMEGVILDLQRNKELQEVKLKYFASNLEQARVVDAIGAGKTPNIVDIDPPTRAYKMWSKPFKKKVQMIAFGGLMAGIGLAFLIELFLDRSIKRPVDVEKKLRLPLFISIPEMGRNGSHQLLRKPVKEPLLLTDAKGSPAGKPSIEEKRGMQIPAWERGHPLRRFYEGLRDRLILHFELANAAQKPKLVALTSCGHGVGVSTIAAGLAATLSETGDGNVLLVDMNSEQGASQQFHKGKPGCGLDDALATETMKSALVHSNLYLATERLEGGKAPRALPGRLSSLMPKLKASDYDYIIFDLPPVSQTSMTQRFSRLMDMVLLVIESEKTSQDLVKQATALLAESNANVSTVLNKTRNYVPTGLHQESLGDV